MANEGTDLHGWPDMRWDWGTVDSETAFAQAMARRLATVPGINANLPAGYGAGAFHYLLEGGITLGQMFGEIERELLKDERAKRIELSQLPDGTLRIRVFSHRADSYPLTLTIDAVNAAILLEQA
jgi:hypothetical protein